MAEGIGLLNQRIDLYTMGSNPISSDGDVVQLAERMLCKHEVTGSSPVISINLGLYIKLIYLILCGAFVAQLVERSHGKGKVFGSSPTVGIKKRVLYDFNSSHIKSF